MRAGAFVFWLGVSAGRLCCTLLLNSFPVRLCWKPSEQKTQLHCLQFGSSFDSSNGSSVLFTKKRAPRQSVDTKSEHTSSIVIHNYTYLGTATRLPQLFCFNPVCTESGRREGGRVKRLQIHSNTLQIQRRHCRFGEDVAVVALLCWVMAVMANTLL